MPRFELGRYAGPCWRFVEDQNVSSTMKLVDSAEDQLTLEHLLDSAKPPVPPACRHLHYLLFTPFRYQARHATRYRPVGDRNGVFYGAEEIETCAAEVAFYRILFFLESPQTAPTPKPFEMTAFRVTLESDAALDVAQDLDAGEVAALSHCTDYGPPHALAAEMRGAGGQVIRFPSVRHAGGNNIAVLTCAAFSDPAPQEFQGWWFRFSDKGIFAIRRFGAEQFEFPYTKYAADPRVAALIA